MNDQIEAYLKQHYCRDYFNAYGDTVEDDHYFMYREEVDGLIELIVKECVKICNRSEDYISAFNIKEHFGLNQ